MFAYNARRDAVTRGPPGENQSTPHPSRPTRQLPADLEAARTHVNGFMVRGQHVVVEEDSGRFTIADREPQTGPAEFRPGSCAKHDEGSAAAGKLKHGAWLVAEHIVQQTGRAAHFAADAVD